jgi:hypothetical protein
VPDYGFDVLIMEIVFLEKEEVFRRLTCRSSYKNIFPKVYFHFLALDRKKSMEFVRK